MIDPKQFYSEEDHPDRDAKETIWRAIARRLFSSKRSAIVIFDRKSFVYGMAASFILMFTIVGMYATFTQMVDHSQPREIKADKAYQSAIHEFESVLYSAVHTHTSSGKDNLSTLQKTRLTYLNGAIDELKRELNTHDLSPLKRQRLFELYNLKLAVLQSMVQQGDFDL